LRRFADYGAGKSNPDPSFSGDARQKTQLKAQR